MEGDQDHFQELCTSTMELLITVGLMDTVKEQWPEVVQMAWHERMYQLKHHMETQAEEAQQFASHYD